MWSLHFSFVAGCCIHFGVHENFIIIIWEPLETDMYAWSETQRRHTCLIWDHYAINNTIFVTYTIMNRTTWTNNIILEIIQTNIWNQSSQVTLAWQLWTLLLTLIFQTLTILSRTEFKVWFFCWFIMSGYISADMCSMWRLIRSNLKCIFYWYSSECIDW